MLQFIVFEIVINVFEDEREITGNWVFNIDNIESFGPIGEKTKLWVAGSAYTVLLSVQEVSEMISAVDNERNSYHG